MNENITSEMPKLYRVTADNKLILVTDNKTKADFMLSNLSGYTDAKTETIEPIITEDTDYLDIIENDIEKDYGYTEVYRKEDGMFDVTVRKYRLSCCNEWLTMSYNDIIEDFCENPGNYEIVPTLKDAVNIHLDYWNQNHTDKNPAVFSLKDEEIHNLLINGFELDRIFVISPDIGN